MKLIIPFADFEQIAISVTYSDGTIHRIEFLPSQSRPTSVTRNDVVNNETVNNDDKWFANKISNEFKQYFLLAEFQFTLRCQPDRGTKFQQKVWQALTEIPVGKVVTYGQLASDLNTSPRAVGNACRNNPLPLIVPCHRVVSATGCILVVMPGIRLLHKILLSAF